MFIFVRLDFILRFLQYIKLNNTLCHDIDYLMIDLFQVFLLMEKVKIVYSLMY